MSNITEATKAIRAIMKDDFSGKGFAREMCWSLSRSLDPKNRYGIPHTITQTVSEIKSLMDPQDPDYDARSTNLAERKMDFVSNLEAKQLVYEQALTVWKAYYQELHGSEFKYVAQKSDDSKRRDAGETKKQLDELMAKYA